MTHLVMFSGGVGSYLTAKRVVAEHGAADVVLLFADTRIEDPSLYRFLEQARDKLDVPGVFIQEGRTPWDVFFDKRFLGNSRVDPCSQVLKRGLLDKYRSRYAPDEVICYIGIDWSEAHRLERLLPRVAPYTYKAPLCDPPFYASKDEMIAELLADGLEVPELYKLGFKHNNCGGFCIKAGIGQFKLLLEKKPELYQLHERKEQELRAYLGKNVSILRDRRGNTKGVPMTMEQLRLRVQAKDITPDEAQDFGGCGCALD